MVLRWSSFSDAFEGSGRPQLAPDLLLAAATKDATSSDMRRRDLAIAWLNSRGAFRLADTLSRKLAESVRAGQASREASSEVAPEPDEAAA